MEVDVIVVLHVTDDADPAPLSPPMFRWSANVTLHVPAASPTGPLSVLVYVLAIAGGVVVLVVVIVVFVVRAKKPGKRSGSFNVRACVRTCADVVGDSACFSA